MTLKQLIRLLTATLAVAVLACSVSGTGLAQAAPAVFIFVNDGGDTDDCTPNTGIWTLRCAINYANAHSGTSIRFAVGLQTILPTSALPKITADFTWIDGHDILDHCVCPIIDGASIANGNGLTIEAANVTISNITVVNTPYGYPDIMIQGRSVDAAIAYDNLGILPGATQCAGLRSAEGVLVLNDRMGAAGNNNGTAYIYANTLSCHAYNGVRVINSNDVYVGAARDGTPLGNYIGVTSDGTRAASNWDAGVEILNSDQVTVLSNLIANNAGAYGSGGVDVAGFFNNDINVYSNTLSANYQGLAISNGSTVNVAWNKIGTSTDGLLPLPNAQEGILISGGSGLDLRANLVAYNGAAGIAVMGITTTASIRNNDIYRNVGLPIDLGNNGPTPGGGPNIHWKPYPVVSTFSGSHVEGMVACGNCFIYIFKAVGNPSAPGGGGIFLMSVPTYGFGLWSVNLPNGLTRFDVTFTMLEGSNTSEMSPRPQLFLPLIRR